MSRAKPMPPTTAGVPERVSWSTSSTYWTLAWPRTVLRAVRRPLRDLQMTFDQEPLESHPDQSGKGKPPRQETLARYALLIDPSLLLQITIISSHTQNKFNIVNQISISQSRAMAKQSGKSFRSFLGVEPSKPTPKDSVLVIVDAVSFLS